MLAVDILPVLVGGLAAGCAKITYAYYSSVWLCVLLCLCEYYRIRHGLSVMLHRDAWLVIVADSWLGATWVATTVCLVEGRGVEKVLMFSRWKKDHGVTSQVGSESL